MLTCFRVAVRWIPLFLKWSLKKITIIIYTNIYLLRINVFSCVYWYLVVSNMLLQPEGGSNAPRSVFFRSGSSRMSNWG